MSPAAFLLGAKLKLYSILRKLLPARRLPTRWQSLGRYLHHTLSDDALEFQLHCSGGSLVVTCHAPGLFRVYSRQQQHPAYRSYSVIPAERLRLQAVPAAAGALRIEVEGTDLALLIELTTCRLTFLRGERELFREAEACRFAGAWVRMDFLSAEKERYLGFGQKTGGLYKNTDHLVMWNTDDSTVDTQSDPTYQSCPLCLGLRADGFAWGVFFDNPHYTVLQPGACKPQALSRYTAERGPLCYYVLPGPELPEVVGQYTSLTGRYPLPPRWVLGHHHSRWEEHESAKRVLELAETFRRHELPCDVLHLDIGHLRGYRCFTWHPQRFPDPGGLIEQLHARGFKVVVIVDPGLKKDPKWEIYRSGLEEDVFCKTAKGKVYHGPVWPGPCAFVEYTRQHALDWWAGQYSCYTQNGVDGFWNDMNEPSIFTLHGTMPDSVRFRTDDGRTYDHKTMHNLFSLLTVKASAAGLAKLRPDQRQFLFCRSSFAGSQRYASTWTGDNSSNWQHLRMSIPMILNMGLSGHVLTGPDTGGFWLKPTTELMLRWIQLATFYPFCRNHTSLATPPQEFWAMGATVLQTARRFLRLRYSLLPYFYTVLAESCRSGLPFMRPLPLEYPQDPRCQEKEIAETEFMVGSGLLVAPVLEPGASEREVYLPAGTDWYYWWSDTHYTGGRPYTIGAPLETIPLCAREGAVVPMVSAGLNTSETDRNPLALHIFPGREISGELYLDDGETLQYQSGDYALIGCTGSWTAGVCRLRLSLREGEPAGSFFFNHPQVSLVLHTAKLDGKQPSQLTVGGNPLANTEWQHSGGHLTITLGLPVLPLEIEVRFS